MSRRNWITVFTEEELRAALGLIGTRESAASVAAQLYAMPPEEQIHFDWLEGTLWMLSCVSDEVARRVLDHFASSPKERARMEAEQKRYCASLGTGEGVFQQTVHSLEDVVFDSRQDVALMAGLAADELPDRNFVALFTEGEVREALTLLGPPEEAAQVAGQLYSLSPAEQAGLRWTDLGLGLLAAVSGELADRVVSTFGTTPERVKEIREMQEFFQEMARDAELKDPRVHLALDTVVRGRGGAPPPAE
jgi:hypothetical protein